MCEKYEHQKEAKLDELKAAEKRRQMLGSEDVNVSISNTLTVRCELEETYLLCQMLTSF